MDELFAFEYIQVKNKDDKLVLVKMRVLKHPVLKKAARLLNSKTISMGDWCNVLQHMTYGFELRPELAWLLE